MDNEWLGQTVAPLMTGLCSGCGGLGATTFPLMFSCRLFHPSRPKHRSSLRGLCAGGNASCASRTQEAKAVLTWPQEGTPWNFKLPSGVYVLNNCWCSGGRAGVLPTVGIQHNLGGLDVPPLTRDTLSHLMLSFLALHFCISVILNHSQQTQE